jgi:hypothetical protein
MHSRFSSLIRTVAKRLYQSDLHLAKEYLHSQYMPSIVNDFLQDLQRCFTYDAPGETKIGVKARL